MNKCASIALLLLATLTVAGEPSASVSAAAASPATAAGEVVDEAVAARLKASLSNAKGAVVRTTPMNGIYEVSRNTELVYVTSDGKYGIAGDLFRLGDTTNLTAPRRRELRLALLGAVPDSDSITFASAAPKYTVTVFTDVDCQYCRHLHNEIDQYNRLGINVRYLFFPRSGPNTESWFKAEQVWCSADRKAALTRAKLGQPLEAKRCAANPVARHYDLASRLGVEGTPYIFTDTGEMFEGLVEPAQLYAALRQQHALAQAPAPGAAPAISAVPATSAASANPR